MTTAADEIPRCVDCGADARVYVPAWDAPGVIWVRRQQQDGHWGEAALCQACWDRQNPGRMAVKTR